MLFSTVLFLQGPYSFYLLGVIWVMLWTLPLNKIGSIYCTLKSFHTITQFPNVRPLFSVLKIHSFPKGHTNPNPLIDNLKNEVWVSFFNEHPM